MSMQAEKIPMLLTHDAPPDDDEGELIEAGLARREEIPPSLPKQAARSRVPLALPFSDRTTRYLVSIDSGESDTCPPCVQDQTYADIEEATRTFQFFVSQFPNSIVSLETIRLMPADLEDDEEYMSGFLGGDVSYIPISDLRDSQIRAPIHADDWDDDYEQSMRNERD